MSSIIVPVAADTWFDWFINGGADATLQAGVYQTKSTRVRRTLMHTDLSPYLGEAISLGKLWLYCEADPPGDLFWLREITSQWSEFFANQIYREESTPWNTPGGDYRMERAVSFTPVVPGWCPITITPLIQYALVTLAGQLDLMLMIDDESILTTRLLSICSKEGSHPPYVELFIDHPRATSRCVGLGADALRLSSGGAEISHLRSCGNLPGTVLLAAAGANGPGTGHLLAGGDGRTLRWRAPGSATHGPAVTAQPASGESSTVETLVLYDGENPDAFVCLDIHPQHLGGAGTARTVPLALRYANGVGGEDVAAADALAGDTQTWQILLQNDSPAVIHRAIVWLDASCTHIEISADGTTWDDPTSEATGVHLGDIPCNQGKLVHIRRTIPAASPSTDGVSVHLHAAFTAFG